MDSCEYQITIKSANQKVADYALVCLSNWTVHRLKQHISETHICKPTVEEQRLIYAGNLLKDSQILKQIFFRDSLCTELTNSNKTDFTIHLVCSTSKATSSESPMISGSHSRQHASSSATLRESTSPIRTNSSSSSRIVASDSGAQSSNDETVNENRIRHNPTTASSNQVAAAISTSISSISNTESTTAPASSPPQPTFSMPSMTSRVQNVQDLLQSDHMRQQMAVFQQLAYVVAAQIAHNLSNNNVNIGNITASGIDPPAGRSTDLAPSFGGQPALNIHVSTSPSNTPLNIPQMPYGGNRPQARDGIHQNENLNNENNAENQVLADQARAQFGFDAQMQAAAGAAPVPDQPVGQQPDQDVAIIQHDVIDWIYYSIRAIVLMAALYIHASMFRLLFLAGLLAIAYFLNMTSTRRPPAGVAREHADAREQLQAQEDANIARQQQQPQDVNQNGHAEVNITGENQQERAINPVAPGRVSFFKLCYLVVTDFLASLVPE